MVSLDGWEKSFFESFLALSYQPIYSWSLYIWHVAQLMHTKMIMVCGFWFDFTILSAPILIVLKCVLLLPKSQKHTLIWLMHKAMQRCIYIILQRCVLHYITEVYIKLYYRVVYYIILYYITEVCIILYAELCNQRVEIRIVEFVPPPKIVRQLILTAKNLKTHIHL